MVYYWLGLLTLPALAGVLAGVYGLYRATGWLIDHSPIIKIKRRNATPNEISGLVGAVAATKSIWAVNISRRVCVLLGIGKVNASQADAIRRGVYAALVPPTRLKRVKAADGAAKGE